MRAVGVGLRRAIVSTGGVHYPRHSDTEFNLRRAWFSALERSPFAVLGLTQDASVVQVKRAFRLLAHKYHPDKPGGDADKFRQIRDAYNLLTDGKCLSQDEQLCEELKEAASSGDLSRGLAVIELLISKQSAVDYGMWMPHFLHLMKTHGKRTSIVDSIERFKESGLLPGELYRCAYNDLLECAANDPTVEFAMDLINIMDKKGLQPELATLHRVFSYFRGVS